MKTQKQKFDKLIQKAFVGEGGDIFKDYYECSLINEWTLKDIADETKYGLNSLKNKKREKNLKNAKINTLNERYDFLSKYLEDIILSNPELCGEIVGALVKEEKYSEAIKFIGLDKLKEDEIIEWKI